jgi:predicted dehydrogenase
MGAAHAGHLANMPAARLAAVADPREDRRQAIAARHGVPAYRDWSEMLERERSLDALIVATPPTIRRGPVSAACNLGLALYCEKPPANDMAEARELTSVVEKAEILNTVGFQYRWSPLANAMRSLVAGQTLSFARLVMAWPVFSWIGAGDAPRELLSHAQTGGPMVSQGIHMQDALRYVTGDEPLEVAMWSGLAAARHVSEGDSEETLALVARHESGMLATHIHNWSYRGTLAELQLVGPDLDLTWRIEERPRLIGQVQGKPVSRKSTADMRVLALEGFVTAVRAGRQGLLRSPFTDACKSLAVCIAANQACQASAAVRVSSV